MQHFFFESSFQRVRDDIADAFVARRATPQVLGFSYRGLVTRNRGLSYASQVSGVVQSDPLLYQDSYVSETYLEARLNPWSTREVRPEGPHRVPDWTRYGPTGYPTLLRALPNDLQTIISKLTLCPFGVFGALTRGPKRCLILPILLPENLIFGRPAGGHRA